MRGTCSCPDHEDRGVRCKHQWAVAYVRRETRHPDGTTKVDEAVFAAPLSDDAGAAPRRPTYAQDWPAYDAAQTEEKARVRVLLCELCDGVAQPPQATGRPWRTLDSAVYATLSRAAARDPLAALTEADNLADPVSGDDREPR